MDIHLGALTSQPWWQMVHGVITWFYTARQTALKHAFKWLVVCRVAMTLWSVQSMMLLAATDLCWVTCTNFTMLVFFHVREVRLSSFLKCNLWFTSLARVADLILPRLVTFVKHDRYPCSRHPTDSTNYQKCVSYFFPFNLIGKLTRAFLTDQSWRVLKSWYTGEGPEHGFRRRFADGLNRS